MWKFCQIYWEYFQWNKQGITKSKNEQQKADLLRAHQTEGMVLLLKWARMPMLGKYHYQNLNKPIKLWLTSDVTDMAEVQVL